MADARVGGWMAGRPAAAIRWVDRLRGAELPHEVTALIAIALVATGGCLFATVAPVAEHPPIGLLRVLAAASALIAIALFAAGPRLPRAGLHLALGAMIVGATVLTAHARTDGGFMMALRSLQWLSVYAALFLTPREARRAALAITAGCLAAVAIAGVPGTVGEAVIACVTVWVATLLLSALVERLRAQADTDHLTGLLNRTGFTKAANREHALAGRTGASLTIAVIDLDGFKHVNDVQGHAAGDRVLSELAEAWTRTVRPGDVLARYGGDEFLVLFPATTEVDAAEPLARMRSAHAAAWSSGVVEWQPRETLADCLARADDRLYEAKAALRVSAPAVSRVRA